MKVTSFGLRTLVFGVLVLGGCSTAPTPVSVANKVSTIGPYVDIAFTDVKPRPIFMSRPEFPPLFRQAGINGFALVDFVLDQHGVPTQVQVVHATDAAFASAAVDAVKRWRFSPASKDGAVVACHMQVPIVFSVDK